MKPWVRTLLVELARGAMNVVGSALGAAAAEYVTTRWPPPPPSPAPQARAKKGSRKSKRKTTK